MQPVIERLVGRFGQHEVEKLLSACLRDLPDRFFLGERRKYLNARDIDEYLKKKRQAFVRSIRKCQRDGELFFAQEITDEVVAFVKANPEIESGVREGNTLYVSKIPYNTKAYLVESDPILKRYHACHCPWAREAIRSGERAVPAFCNCSAGFHKKPWEVIFGQPLKVEVLESALKGDSRCRFAIHLPE
jgi:predicted hydrocarbon binding protein